MIRDGLSKCKENNSRNVELDVTRGIAILVVFLGHAMQRCWGGGGIPSGTPVDSFLPDAVLFCYCRIFFSLF